MIKIISAVLIGLVLSGCATQRPQMTDAQYREFSYAWATLHQCNMAGEINGEMAAKGRVYLTTTMSGYSFDGQRIKSEADNKVVYGSKPTAEECRALNSSIYGRKLQIENQNAQATMQYRESNNMMQTNKPTNTYCNKIGTQVLCNSF